MIATLHATPATPWLLRINVRQNPTDEMSYPIYGEHQMHRFRTRAEARQFLREWVTEAGLRVSAAVPSRHGILVDDADVAQYSYGIRKVA